MTHAKRRVWIQITSLLLAACALAWSLSAAAADPLPSWNEGTAKQSILAFVGKVTKLS